MLDSAEGVMSPTRANKQREYQRQYYAKNKEKIKATSVQWAKANPEKIRAKSRAYKQKATDNSRRWRKENPERHKQNRTKQLLKSRYNWTPQQFEIEFEKQHRCCAICKATKPGTTHNWHVDHDHKTGVVRGILCHHCNTLLGYAKDNCTTLLAAVEYLERQCLKN